jgi:hypothetical protein
VSGNLHRNNGILRAVGGDCSEPLGTELFCQAFAHNNFPVVFVEHSAFATLFLFAELSSSLLERRETARSNSGI